MRYRTFGAIDFEPSALGFGAMRLPLLSPDAQGGKDGKRGKDDPGAKGAPAPRRIDEQQATDMLRRAVDAGVNYVDTAYVYHNGESEPWLGRALRQVAADLYGPGAPGLAALRRRVKVATKLPVWKLERRDDAERFFSEQLERLQLDSIDFYLLHGLGAGSLAKLRELDVFDWAERALADGRIGHLGFSFHDEEPVFEELVDATDLWEFCQIQYNYMDEAYQAGTRGLEYASAKGLGVIVMEPLRGGQLARRPPAGGRRALGRRRCPPRGRRPSAAGAGRLGAAVGLEPSRGVVSAFRHERYGTARAEHRERRPLRTGDARRR